RRQRREEPAADQHVTSHELPSSTVEWVVLSFSPFPRRGEGGTARRAGGVSPRRGAFRTRGPLQGLTPPARLKNSPSPPKRRGVKEPCPLDSRCQAAMSNSPVPLPRRQFASDTYAGMCPEAFEAFREANRGHAPAYGDDEWTAAITAELRRLF